MIHSSWIVGPSYKSNRSQQKTGTPTLLEENLLDPIMVTQFFLVIKTADLSSLKTFFELLQILQQERIEEKKSDWLNNFLIEIFSKDLFR